MPSSAPHVPLQMEARRPTPRRDGARAYGLALAQAAYAVGPTWLQSAVSVVVLPALSGDSVVAGYARGAGVACGAAATIAAGYSADARAPSGGGAAARRADVGVACAVLSVVALAALAGVAAFQRWRAAAVVLFAVAYAGAVAANAPFAGALNAHAREGPDELRGSVTLAFMQTVGTSVSYQVQAGLGLSPPVAALVAAAVALGAALVARRAARRADRSAALEEDNTYVEEGNPMLSDSPELAARPLPRPPGRDDERQTSVRLRRQCASMFLWEMALSVTSLQMDLLEGLAGARGEREATRWLALGSWVDSSAVVVACAIAYKAPGVIWAPRGRSLAAVASGLFVAFGLSLWPRCRGLAAYLVGGSLFFGAGHGFRKIVGFAALANACPRARRAQGAAWWLTSSAAGSAVGSAALPLLAREASLAAAYGAAAIVGVLSACVLAYDLVVDAAKRPAPRERFVVTGGFFDGSAEGYVAELRLERRRSGARCDYTLSWRRGALVEPPDPGLAVPDKGLTGACWRADGALWACFPNTIVALDPLGWRVGETVTHPHFNDLHGVAVAPSGSRTLAGAELVVANTGLESVDGLGRAADASWELAWRVALKESPAGLAAAGAEDVEERMRALCGDGAPEDILYRWRTLRRTCGAAAHRFHVSGVAWGDDGRVVHTDGRVVYTLGRARQIRVLEEEAGTLVERDACAAGDLGTAPLHDGRVCIAPALTGGEPVRLLWATSVIGAVTARDAATGALVREWTHAELAARGAAHGWCRGLRVLADGFLLGTTLLHNDRARKYADWPFGASETTTAVTFVPFDPGTACCTTPDAATAGIDGVFEGGRSPKIFSILPM